MQMSESKERYIETIYRLSHLKGYVQAIDVANHLNFSKPSVSRAMKELLSLGMIEIGSHNEICLTEIGGKFAQQLHKRYLYFYKLLINKGVDKDAAECDAQKLMSAISEEGFQKIQSSI